MDIERWESYTNGKERFSGEREEAFVAEVTDDEVTWLEIEGWDYGWPHKGRAHTTPRGQFERRFPKHIPYVQAP